MDGEGPFQAAAAGDLAPPPSHEDIARGDGLDQFQNRDWMEVTAKMAVEKHKAYKGKGPVMHVISLSPCKKPADEVVTF